MADLKKTAFNQAHRDLKANLMDFAGWELPAWYTSITDEHRACRTSVAMWDVSDMGRLWITGRNARTFLDKVLSKPVSSLKWGMSQLCVLLLEDGGILDDLWVYAVEPDRYAIVWNAGDHEKKLEWLKKWQGNDPDIVIEDVLMKTAMLSVQGPGINALKASKNFLDLPRFGNRIARIGDIETFTARTGYTGEDGLEIVVDAGDADALWNMFMDEGVKPGGLGARDMLRIEAGLLLSGIDFDSSRNLYEASYSWVAELDTHEFIGKEAMLKIKSDGVRQKHIGFKVEGREIARAGHKIVKNGKEIGVVTSGTPSLTLGFNIGFGYVDINEARLGNEFDIIIRNKPVRAILTNRKFYSRKEQQ